MHWDNMKLLIAIDEVMERYASQFQTNTDLVTTEICVLRDMVAELEDKLRECKVVLENRERMSARIMQSVADEVKSLINKGK